VSDTKQVHLATRTRSFELPRELVDGIRRIFLRTGVLPFALTIAVLGFGIASPRMFSLDNIVNVARNSSYLIIVSMGQMLCLLSRGMDLSVSSTTAVVSISATLVMSHMFHLYPDMPALAIGTGIAAGLAVSILIGAVNGAGISLLNVNPFIMTVGMLSILSGAALQLSGGMPIYDLPPQFSQWFAYAAPLGIPMPVIFVSALFLILCYVLYMTPLGRYIYAIGGNESAAHLAGIRTKLYTAITYVLCSFIVGIGSILLTARVATGEPTLGQGLLIQSITAVVIGGVSLFGGIGRVGNVVLGALFVIIVSNGMNLNRIGSYTQEIVLGTILIIAVVVDMLRNRLLRHQRLE
jgi:ribose transport system permease protein